MSSAEAPLPAGACRLTLDNRPEATVLACALARRFAAGLGFDERELGQIELGVEEAVSNVVRHAFAPDELNHFDVVLRPCALGLEVLIRDQGRPFDPSSVPAFDPEAEDPMTGGLGMHLIRSAFDEVEYRNLGQGGKETRLLKYRELALIEPRPLPAGDLAVAEPVHDIRLFQPEDALEVARLIHEAYGYSYPFEHIYFPERVAALNASGELVSALALGESGTLAGHAALVLDPNRPDRAELAIVVTRPGFRGQGVARRLGDFLLDQARARGLRLLFTNAVTAHPYTQRFMQQLGFRDCALLPGHAPASLRFRKIAERLPQRESCVYAVRFLDAEARAPRRAVLPARHRAVIEAIHAELELPLRVLAPGPLPALPARARIDAAVHHGLELAQLRLLAWGEDALEVLRARLAEFRRARMAVIELQLPCGEAHTAQMLDAVEALGFVFTGVEPGVRPDEDQLVLNLVNDVGFDYAALALHSPLAQRLREHILHVSA